MNKIKKLVFLMILMIPLCINAKSYTYDNAINKANTYIDSFDDYNDYIKIGSMPYDYYENSVKRSIHFKKGGFLSEEEFKMTNVTNHSYLATGLEYWTLTQSSNKRNYVVSYSLNELDINKKANVRITEYVKNETKIEGAGTKNDPWYFQKVKNINLYLLNENRGDLGEDDCIDTDKKITLIQNGTEDVGFYICPKEGYRYYSSSCKEFIKSDSTTDDKFVINGKFDDNVICSIDIMYKTDKITTQCDNCDKQSKPNVFYIAKNRDKWFTDEWGFNEVTKLTSLPEKTGYLFQGYYTEENGNGTQIIDKYGNIISTNIPENIPSDYKIYADWTPITYTVVFDANGGSGTMNTITCTYDLPCNTLTNNFTKDNSYFMGWTKTKETTSSNSGTSLNKINFENGGKINENLTTINGSTVTIYAKWLSCQTGTLTNDPSKGFVCLSSSQKYSYDCNCDTCTSYYTCMTSSGGCGSYSSYSYRCQTGSYSCCTGTYVRHDAVCRVWGTCPTYGTCTGTRYNDAPCYGTCSNSYPCNCSTCYACNSGWTAYSGSGTSVVCYKGTIIK